MLQEIEKPQDTYADFVVRVVSPQVKARIADLTERVSMWESQQKRESVGGLVLTRGCYKRGSKMTESLRDALGRFVGLLRIAKAYPNRTGKVFRSLKKERLHWSARDLHSLRRRVEGLGGPWTAFPHSG